MRALCCRKEPAGACCAQRGQKAPFLQEHILGFQTCVHRSAAAPSKLWNIQKSWEKSQVSFLLDNSSVEAKMSKEILMWDNFRAVKHGRLVLAEVVTL